MSQATTGQQSPTLRSILAPHAPEFEAAANETDDPAEADTFVVLAALGSGQTPPEGPARRMLERAREGNNGD